MSRPFMAYLDSLEADGSVLDTIKAGDRVTIRTPHGSILTGKAVMRGPAGWVLNLGGAHGTPGIASAANLVKVTRRGKVLFR